MVHSLALSSLRRVYVPSMVMVCAMVVELASQVRGYKSSKSVSMGSSKGVLQPHK